MAKTKKPTEHIIYDSRFDYAEFEAWMEDNSELVEEFEHNEDALMDVYMDYLRDWAGDEEANLNKQIEGVIVGFADLGFWDGRTTGAKRCGTNVNSILSLGGCSDGKFYCDRYNVKSALYHHDGTHYVTYRIAKDEDAVERIMERAGAGALTLDYFNRNTKTLRPYVAEVYGW